MPDELQSILLNFASALLGWLFEWLRQRRKANKTARARSRIAPMILIPMLLVTSSCAAIRGSRICIETPAHTDSETVPVPEASPEE